MTAVSPSEFGDVRSPDEIAKATDSDRLYAYSEDWVTAPRLAESGLALGPETHRQVLALLAKGIDETQICQDAFAALTAEEHAITQKQKKRGWLAFVGCLGIAGLAALLWTGRGDAHHLSNGALLGSIGLMVANGMQMSGARRSTRLIRSREQRKDVWRRAIAAMANDGS
jgi:hypothetical protein